MAWLMIKSVAGQVLNLRTLLMAVGAAIGGGAVIAALGLFLIDAATRAMHTPAQFRWAILPVAGAVYALAGGVAGGHTVLLGSLQRALDGFRPTLRLLVERIAAGAVKDLPQNAGSVEIARIDALLDGLFDAMARSTQLPLLRHFAGAAAAVGRWRLRREIDPYLQPLRHSGATHVSADAIRSHLIDAGCKALIAPAADQLARSKRLVWLVPAVLVLIPAGFLCYRLLG